MRRLLILFALIIPIGLGLTDAVQAKIMAAATDKPKLRYASAVPTLSGSGHALALVFANNFAPKGNFSDYIIVIDDHGDHVGGHWQVAARRNVLLFAVPTPGTYHVILTPGLSSAQGAILRTRFIGRLTVQ